ncbi:gliding motility lipoprotein GldK [Belliella kenyensis]|uniref:Gliding motility lipoprotein GldK n=1 Tax=Belliella kenyensis TaxID=1472724 RepID=A0ABV8ER91_9BACT|nr:gliding motility lipoprotein GldK [Belliella kenyensis]MCH7402553.1 gliding motility lipoprotein GldK [Belliella kenyensis]MDN3603351.1 gliding motility lipoprotein GldK [Belliella kenyensis]
MCKKMISRFFPLLTLVLIASLLQGCGLFGKKGTASEKDNRRGEVTGVAKRVGWQQNLPIDMVAVKAGTFWMGQADEDIGITQSAFNRQVTISEFYMDKYEVSNNKYRQFVEAVRLGEYSYSTPTTLKDPPQFNLNEVLPDTTVWNTSFSYHYGDPLMEFYFDHPAFDNYPVVGVSWEQANMYCQWRTYHMNANDKSNFEMPPFRLPSEAEWEYAAKGGKDVAKYPWGGPYLKNKRGCLMANFKPGRGNYIDDGFSYTAPVDVYAPNGFGLYNMAGNVSEWVLDDYSEVGTALTWDLDPVYKKEGESRKVVRGGSWKDIAHYLETSTRTYEYQDVKTAHIGFRTTMTFIGRSGSMEVNNNRRRQR